MTGDGSGRPDGFMDNANIASTNSGSAVTIADANGQANGLIDLYHSIKSAYVCNATWALNRTTHSAVRKLKDNQTGYVWMPGLADLRPNTILGQPYVEVPDMPDESADAFPIAFGDFRRSYTIVDRVNISVLRNPFTQATSGAIRFFVNFFARRESVGR